MKRYKNKREEYKTALDMLAIGLEGKTYLPKPSKLMLLTALLFISLIIKPLDPSVNIVSNNVALPAKPKILLTQKAQHRS